MRINHNISALKANNQLGKTNAHLDKSLKKLSSGYRINNAADDAAGLAISEKMRTQISGLEQASRNGADGISVIQTAEGALIEVTAMLQRMRELSVQAANGTYTNDDRIAIQAEINQLNEEIKRIAETTEFNTMTLLDGNIDRRSFSSNNKVQVVALSDTVSVGGYDLTITQDARQAVLVGNTSNFTGAPSGTTVNKDSSININGMSINIKEGENLAEVFEKIRNACDNTGLSVFAIAAGATHSPTGDPDLAGYTSKPFAGGDRLAFISKEYGSNQEIKVYCDNPDLCDLLGLTIAGATAKGIDAVATIASGGTSQYSNTATVSIQGNKVTVSDKDNFNMVLQIDPGTVKTVFTDRTIPNATAAPGAVTPPAPPAVAPLTIPIRVSVLDAGPMDLQIGANEGQTMSVRIPRVTPETLGIDKVNIGTAAGAQQAISLLDTAINQVTAIRSKLGAYQNRLEHAISNLDVTSENLTESLSRIKDVDMAEEMANYTQKNVLAQAGTAMLAQANQRPQTILSLLQG